jgi:hypothetical protein
MKIITSAALLFLLGTLGAGSVSANQWCKKIHSATLQVHARSFCRQEKDETPMQPQEISAAGLPPMPTTIEYYPGEVAGPVMGPPGGGPPPPSLCITPAGNCPMQGYFPTGSPCACPTPYGPVNGATYP